MIDIVKQQLLIGDKMEPIKNWEVWFQTPYGLAVTIDQALATVKSADLSPHMVIAPVAVAVSETMYEVVSR